MKFMSYDILETFENPKMSRDYSINFENLKTSTFFVIGERSNIALKKMIISLKIVP